MAATKSVYVRGEKGVVTLTLFVEGTGRVWGDICYHAPTPVTEGDGPGKDPCVFLDHKPCHFSSRALTPEKVLDLWGSLDLVRDTLRSEYEKLFGDERGLTFGRH